jgi:hypothetical protein
MPREAEGHVEVASTSDAEAWQSWRTREKPPDGMVTAARRQHMGLSELVSWMSKFFCFCFFCRRDVQVEVEAGS